MSDEVVDRTLAKNKVREFVLRIDLIPSAEFNGVAIVEALSKFFDTTEKRQITGFKIQFTNNMSEVTNNEAFDYVLISKSRNITMTYSEVQHAIIITSGQYKNNSVYKDIVKKTIDVITGLSCEVEAKRIGLRYINEFSCNNNKQISKIYGARLTSVTKSMIHDISQSRIIGLEEYIYDEMKMRLQYGVPNKFYPSAITIFDLLLDIDVYSEDVSKPSDWEMIISRLNHAAYEKFVKEMNSKFIEGLK